MTSGSRLTEGSKMTPNQITFNEKPDDVRFRLTGFAHGENAMHAYVIARRRVLRQASERSGRYSTAASARRRHDASATPNRRQRNGCGSWSIWNCSFQSPLSIYRVSAKPPALHRDASDCGTEWGNYSKRYAVPALDVSDSTVDSAAFDRGAA